MATISGVHCTYEVHSERVRNLGRIDPGKIYYYKSNKVKPMPSKFVIDNGEFGLSGFVIAGLLSSTYNRVDST